LVLEAQPTLFPVLLLVLTVFTLWVADMGLLLEPIFVEVLAVLAVVVTVFLPTLL
jgi:hypothetical protein